MLACLGRDAAGRNILADENVFIGLARLLFRSGNINTGLFNGHAWTGSNSEMAPVQLARCQRLLAWGVSGAYTLLLWSSPTCENCC